VVNAKSTRRFFLNIWVVELFVWTTGKLVALKKEPWRLYNLAQDRIETNDLAAEHPDRVQAMSAEWEKWAGQVGL